MWSPCRREYKSTALRTYKYITMRGCKSSVSLGCKYLGRSAADTTPSAGTSGRVGLAARSSERRAKEVDIRRTSVPV